MLIYFDLLLKYLLICFTTYIFFKKLDKNGLLWSVDYKQSDSSSPIVANSVQKIKKCKQSFFVHQKSTYVLS